MSQDEAKLAFLKLVMPRETYGGTRFLVKDESEQILLLVIHARGVCDLQIFVVFAIYFKNRYFICEKRYI
jgi:hypothetical protein